VGELSRKERDDIKPLFVSKGGARVFEDFKRIETSSRGGGEKKVREKAGAAADDLLVLVVGSAQSGHPRRIRATQSDAAEMAIYASAGLLRVALAQKYSDRHGIFKKTGEAITVFCG
jgi:aspartyl-tRNA synthetase